MLGPGRYLLGAAELLALVGFAWLGAARVRGRLVPGLRGAPAHLATVVVTAAILIWAAELLGTFALFEPVPYLLLVAAVGIGLRVGVGEGPSRRPTGAATAAERPPAAGRTSVATAIALVVAAVAVLRFALETKTKLGTGMTGFDTTWYHGPFAAGFLQSGDTWDLHFIAPQFLAWFYPANAEILHGAGMLAFGRDLLSPLLNLGWFGGCLAACWCIGRPYRVGPWSLAFGAVALSLPVLSDQAGEMRNDIVGIFFLLAAVALALEVWAGGRDRGVQAGRDGPRNRGVPVGALVLVGLGAGLAAGTKLNFALPGAVLVVGLATLAPRGARWRSLLTCGAAALAGGGYWYLRNLAHSGNPLPWFDSLGPISLPAPGQALGGREAHSVLGYLTDGAVWSDWFAPGLHGALTFAWPLFLLAALAGLLLALLPAAPPSRGSKRAQSVQGEPRDGSGVVAKDGWDPVLALVGLVGLAAALAWLVAPTSASGPEGMPRGFESGLRYLAPVLVLGLALLPAVPPLRARFATLARTPIDWRSYFRPPGGRKYDRERAGGAGLRVGSTPRSQLPPHSGQKYDRGRGGWWGGSVVAAVAVLLAVAVGYPVQRHYLDNRYADPTFASPGLNAAFEWARDLDGARVATTSTRQYPLLGTDLSNRVQFVGEERPHGGFVAPTTCRRWRRLLNAGHYDYVVTSRDRLEPGKPPYPATTRWTEGPRADVVLKKPPTVVFRLTGPLDPSSCPG